MTEKPSYEELEKRVAALEVEKAAERKQFLESVLYHAPDAIVTLDSEHRVTEWNPGAVNMFGYTPEEAIGMPLDDLVARGERYMEAGQKTRQVLSGSRVEAFETVRYRKDGTPLRVIAAGSPIMVDGALTGVVAVYTDITERVRAEAALKESEEKFRTLVEESPLGIVLIATDGRYRYANPEFVRMFGYSLQEIPNGGAWFRKAFPDRTYRHSVVRTWIDDFRHSPVGKARGRVFTVMCKDGARKEIHFRPVSMANMDQFVICEDITEKKRLEQKFQQAQKFEAIGTLAGGLAHDFNNLLMGIQGRASLISVDLEPSHPHREHLDAIEEYIRSAAGITKQLLGFAREGKYDVRPIDLNELLVSSAAMFGRTQKELRIRTKLQSPAPVVEADWRQIEQVLLNLFVNAWQAMPEGGELYLETRAVFLDDDFCEPYEAAPGRYAKIVVTDTGTGMDHSVRQRIFDPFFTTKGKGRGTGLGLASAYGIVKSHGGVITVTSEVGQGATFDIYLPLSDRSASLGESAEPGMVRGVGTLLLVDDEKMVLQVGKAMLERLGYRVLVASGGQEAADVVAKMPEEIDLVILDMIMPGIEGGRTFDLIREIRPGMPVILSSGYSQEGQANDILKRGCNGFIQKPFTLAELSKKIRVVLDGTGEPAI
jgi:PAS domain S-box-containing protein